MDFDIRRTDFYTQRADFGSRSRTGSFLSRTIGAFCPGAGIPNRQKDAGWLGAGAVFADWQRGWAELKYISTKYFRKSLPLDNKYAVIDSVTAIIEELIGV
jgi:hypothetical protein